MTTNDQLFIGAYAGTHIAADALTKIATVIGAGNSITPTEFLEPIGKVRKELETALSAVRELENRAMRIETPKRG